MTIKKITDGTKLTAEIEGRIDTTTAPDLEDDLRASLDGITELVLDFGGVKYISSAGLRVLLSLHKQLSEQGEMKLTNVSEDVLEIFEVTGFSDILTVE